MKWKNTNESLPTATFRYETYTDDKCALDSKRAEVMVSFDMEDDDIRLAGYSINTVSQAYIYMTATLNSERLTLSAVP